MAKIDDLLMTKRLKNLILWGCTDFYSPLRESLPRGLGILEHRNFELFSWEGYPAIGLRTRTLESVSSEPKPGKHFEKAAKTKKFSF